MRLSVVTVCNASIKKLGVLIKKSKQTKQSVCYRAMGLRSNIFQGVSMINLLMFSNLKNFLKKICTYNSYGEAMNAQITRRERCLALKIQVSNHHQEWEFHRKLINFLSEWVCLIFFWFLQESNKRTRFMPFPRSNKFVIDAY